jgi:hypothetical protein
LPVQAGCARSAFTLAVTSAMPASMSNFWKKPKARCHSSGE